MMLLANAANFYIELKPIKNLHNQLLRVCVTTCVRVRKIFRLKSFLNIVE